MGEHGKVVAGVALSALVVSFAASSCVFELGAVVEPALGGAGGAGGDVGAAGGDAGGANAVQRTRIDVSTAALTGSHVDFPLLVEIASPHIDYALAGAAGDNVRFYAEDGTTLLAHEIEQWVVGARSYVWVRLPVAEAGSDAVVWMQVGDRNPPEPASPQSVWSSYAAVYHLGDAVPGPVRDATARALHGTPVMMTQTNVTEARFASGLTLAGVSGPSPHVDLGDDDVLRVPPGGVLTAELWFRRGALTNYGYMLSMEGCCAGWGMTWVPSPLQFRSLVGVTDCCNGGSGAYTYAQFTFPGGDDDVAWHHVVAVMDRVAGASTVYLDGNLESTEVIDPSSIVNQGRLSLGASFAGDDGFDGTLDEVRFSTRVVPADWVAFQYATMAGAAVTIGTPEALP